MTLVYCLLMCVASFLIFSELEAAGGKSFALRLIESSIDKVDAIDDTPVMDLSGKDITPKDTTIELQDVGFSYGDHQILNHVNLTIPAKTTTAIVGPSGSGKTTLCSASYPCKCSQAMSYWIHKEACKKEGPGMTALRFAGRILLSPVLLALKLLLLFSTFLAAVSMGLLSIVSSLLGIMAVLVMFTVSMESGVALMVLAWLISPIGLPLLAEKLLYFLSDLCFDLQNRLWR